MRSISPGMGVWVIFLKYFHIFHFVTKIHQKFLHGNDTNLIQGTEQDCVKYQSIFVIFGDFCHPAGVCENVKDSVKDKCSHAIKRRFY